MKQLQAVLYFFKKVPKKFLLGGFILLLIILFFSSRQKAGLKMEFADVKRGDLQSITTASGKLAGQDSANLKFRSGGKLAFLSVKAGDRVFASQTIAGLDTQDLSIILQQAQNNLRDKQAALEKVLDDIHLFQYGNGGFSNIGTASETETQKQLRTSAEVARDNAEDNVRAAQRDFQDSVLSSPLPGLVIQADVLPGQFVGATDSIAQIVDDSVIYFNADVDEADIGHISFEQKAQVSLDAYPNQTFTGHIAQILPQTKTTSNNATVITVRILLNNPPHFISGLNGQTSIITSEVKNVLYIPQEAVRADETVVISSPSGIRSVKVTTGLRSDTDVEIKSGLSEGERVVTNPPGTLSRGSSNPLNNIMRFFRRGR